MMRSFELRTQPTILTKLKEPPKLKKKRKLNWQRISFILIVIFVILYIAIRSYKQVAVIQANAQIELHKQLIHFPTDVRIQELYIQRGAEIKEGDTLFRYTIPLDNLISTSEINIDKPIEWIQREKINTQKNIEMKRIVLQELDSRINLAKNMKSMKKSLILLGSTSDRNEFDDLSLDINRLEAEREATVKEINYLQSFYKRLDSEDSNYKRIETRKKAFIENEYYFISKLDGIVGQINYNENEICYRKEELMTIHKNDQFNIKAYFDPQDLKFLTEGDVVNVEFPDNINAKGVISNFHIATYALPEEFQEKYKPTERNIVAEVHLIEPDKTPFMNYYKMNVLITKNRYKL